MKYFLSSLIFSVLIVAGFSLTTTPVHAAAPDDGSRAGQETNRPASGFVPLVGIPYVDTTDPNLSLAGYVNALYKAAISIAAFMAVVKIIFAGVKYMLSDVVTTKESAKKDIRGALIGLLIVIGAVLILNTINPQLKGLRALDGPPVDVNLRGVQVPITGPLDSERAQCRARGDEYEFYVKRVSSGENNREATITTECCLPAECSTAPASPNTSDIIVLVEHPVEQFAGLDPAQKIASINNLRSDCEGRIAKETSLRVIQEELKNGIPPGSTNVTVVFVEENSPERYSCVQRSSN